MMMVMIKTTLFIYLFIMKITHVVHNKNKQNITKKEIKRERKASVQTGLKKT